MKPGSISDWALKHSFQPGVSKLIIQIPNHHTGITRFHAHHNSELTMSLGGIKPGKEDASLPSKKCRRIGLLSWAPRLNVPTYCWNGWRTADWVAKGSPTQCSGGCSHSLHSWCSPQTITTMYICLPQTCCEGPQWCKPKWLNPHRWKWYQYWNLKIESTHYKRHHCIYVTAAWVIGVALISLCTSLLALTRLSVPCCLILLSL